MVQGATYTKSSTFFCLFSPIADEVILCLYDDGDCGTEKQTFPMTKGQGKDKDMFYFRAYGDLDGTYYAYKIIKDQKAVLSHDPYAKACGVNGNRSMVIDLKRTDPDGFENEVIPEFKSKTDMVITEVSVADVSSDESAHSRFPGKFKAFTEKHIMDYFVDMGVTHIQIMPSYDFASVDESSTRKQYNWGYDPYNYNVPEGSYSTDPYDGAVRIKEYKEMIQAIHKAGMGVIMDVVYNHTYDVYGSCFYKTSGNYFYRMNKGGYSDASACGNEIASEKPMVRQYIIDSLCYWVREYHIDGFRFDLMGVLDIETLNLARKELQKINPDIILYGEGWTGGESTLPEDKRAMKINACKMNGYGMFSDDIRDTVKGHVFYMDEPGFVNGADGKEDDIRQSVICFPWAKEPYQSINYLSCHDNYTLWDRLIVSNSDSSVEERIRMNKLAAAILFTAQGIPFFLMGEEFARTKPVLGTDTLAENSYNLPLYTNSIKYDRAEKFKDLREYYKGLIAMRKGHKAFRLDTKKQIRTAVKFIDTEEKVVAYTINTEKEDVFVVYNANGHDISLNLPDSRNWDVYVDDTVSQNKPVKTIKDQTKINRLSCLVAISKNQ